jgi:hypothetical protein
MPILSDFLFVPVHQIVMYGTGWNDVGVSFEVRIYVPAAGKLVPVPGKRLLLVISPSRSTVKGNTT